MELRFVVPNMEKTFGNLEFAGENTTEQQRINGRMAVINRSYNLYSDVQRADDVVVVLPAKAGEKHFSPEQKVKLINPRITTDGYKIGERGFVNYILLADDMLPSISYVTSVHPKVHVGSYRAEMCKNLFAFPVSRKDDFFAVRAYVVVFCRH